MSMTTRILLGLALGTILGLGLAWFDPALAKSAATIAQPVGRLWLNALQMTVVPLVLALVIIGVSAANDAAASGRTARRAMVVFALLLAAGAMFAALAAPLMLSLLPRDPILIEHLRAAIPEAGTTASAVGFGDWFTAIIPANAIAAAAQSAMLPLVVFALFFGFALTRIEAVRRARMIEFFQTVADIMIVIVHWVLWAAPLGVFALVLAVCATAGGSVISALGWYIALLCSLYVTITLLMYPLAVFAGGVRLRRFAAAILPAQVVAASTQSSLASLPAMIESARGRLDHPPAVAALVLPMAVSLFRITSPVQYIGAASFIAWIYGIDVPAAQIAAAAALAVVISLGSVGLPGQVSFMATTMPVTSAMGLPLDPLGLLLAVDTIPDVFATVGNVSADLTANTIVAHHHDDEAGIPEHVAGDT
ncbi:MAG: cation:dicarboxylase symporter family transporter [Dokdonella sp.]|uniref:dicarboxylate/amino acid:cation symporter n=2 Tax=Dokdonella sp. TaxID=2291710 RepID=UPI002CFE7A8F|nr:cation:dicarboxylase symporter family transporter [Xanthomonadales bacterium]HQV72407.1 cation:dicarboxylase symporter family transporter [Dokdonella sp.]MBL0223104.1 cation:dicarboxylase symporter family transporter [Xanthomonadales bacterium]HQW76743.1 cation:dicarboxylase symporter family transporter [Dokdonella sp.]HQX65464.1 cation:dicarboxylase symporter family transporter [Dokdonella sp.]